jgi:hypothetical protein
LRVVVSKFGFVLGEIGESQGGWVDLFWLVGGLGFMLGVGVQEVLPGRWVFVGAVRLRKSELRGAGDSGYAWVG